MSIWSKYNAYPIGQSNIVYILLHSKLMYCNEIIRILYIELFVCDIFTQQNNIHVFVPHFLMSIQLMTSTKRQDEWN